MMLDYENKDRMDHGSVEMEINTSAVEAKLKELKVIKSREPDNTNARVVKVLANETCLSIGRHFK